MTEADSVTIDPKLSHLAAHSDSKEFLRYLCAKQFELVARDRLWSEALKRIFSTVADIPPELVEAFTARLLQRGFGNKILIRMLCEPIELVQIANATAFVKSFLRKWPD